MNSSWRLVVAIVALSLPAKLLAEINHYVEAVVSDAASYEKLLDDWMKSDDARRAGHRLTLMSVIANGPSAATHVVVAQVADYTGIDRLLRTASRSKDWQALQAAAAAICKADTEGHAVVLASYGSPRWEEGDVIAVLAMRIKDEAAYEMAFSELQGSTPGKQAPGMVRLMRTMEGGAVSHYVLVTGPGFDAVNRYLDAMKASAEYARFQSAGQRKRRGDRNSIHPRRQSLGQRGIIMLIRN